jgi:hypothetical protein
MKKLKYYTYVLLMIGISACGAKKPNTQENKQDSTLVSPEKTEVKGEQNAATPQETTGVFVGIEQGDYFYFKVKTDSGEEKSFMVLNPDEIYSKIEAESANFQGKKVKVYWQAKKQNIPEAGGEIDIQEYIKAEILP